MLAVVHWRPHSGSTRASGSSILRSMQVADPWRRHGPRSPEHPLVLDSPHSGRVNPADFGTVLDETALRSGEDSFVDELYLPATARGVPLLAAQWSRLYLDVNRQADDIDPEV